MDDIVKQFIQTTLNTAHKNKWTPGGFANNAVNGVGDLVGGAVNLVNPLSQTNPIRVAVTHPEQVAPMTKQFIKSVAGSINNTVGQPVNPQTLQLQTPSLEKAEQYAYDKPVDVAANLAMGAGTVAKVAKSAGILGKASEAGNVAKVADTVSKTAPEGWTSEGMKTAQGLPSTLPSVPGMNLVPKTAEELKTAATKQAIAATPDVSNTAANLYLKPFVVRSRIAENIGGYQKADQLGVAKRMIDDGITGNIEDIHTKAGGILDATEKMKRQALGGVTDGINATDATKTINDGLSKIPELAGKNNLGARNVYQTQLKAYLPQSATMGTASNALEVYDSMRAIRNQGYALIDSGSDKVTRSALGENGARKIAVGNVYLNVAKELNDKLDQKLGDIPIVNLPNEVQKISAISPNAAERLQQGVTRWKDMQKYQKDFIDIQDMAKDTMKSSNAPFSKLTNMASDAIAKGGGAAAGGLASGLNPLGVMGGYALGQIASPFIQQAVEKFMPKIMTGAAGTINKIQQAGLPSLSPKVPGLPTIGETALNQPTSLPAEAGGQTAQNGQANSTTPYSMPTQNGILTTQDYTTQQNTLTQQIAQAKATGNTVQQSQLEGQLAQLNNNWNNQKTIRDSGVTVNNVVGLGNAAHALIQNADISLLNLNGSFDKLLTSTDPKNAALGKALQSIQNATGINLSSAKTKDALIAGLDQAVAVAQNQYNAQLQQYSGGAKPTVQKPQGLPSATAQGGLPPIGTPVNYNFDFGSNGEGIPATP